MTTGYGAYYQPNMEPGYTLREVVRDLTHGLDPYAHSVPGLQEAAARGPAARRRAGCDDIARPQRESRSFMCHLRGHREDEVGTRRVLHQLIVHPQANGEIAEIFDLLEGAEPRPHGQRAIEGFLADPVEVKRRIGSHPLAAQMIAGRQIV